MFTKKIKKLLPILFLDEDRQFVDHNNPCFI